MAKASRPTGGQSVPAAGRVLRVKREHTVETQPHGGTTSPQKLGRGSKRTEQGATQP